jgi:YVTN family beta-propeller protein
MLERTFMNLRHRFAALSLLLTFTAAPLLAAGAYHVAHTYELGVSGGWDYLTFDAATHSLFIAQGDKVLVFDTRSGTVTGKIGGMVRTHGVILSPDGKTIYVSDGGAGVVRIIDHATLTQTGSIAVGNNPDGMVLEPTTGHLFVFCGRSKDLYVLDLATQKVVAQVPLPGKPEFPVADGAGFVYDNIEDLHQLVKIDAAQNKVVDTWTFAGCESPSGQAIDVAGKRAFSVCDNGRMTVTELPKGKQIATVVIGQGPDAAVFDATQKLAFSSNGDVGTLSIVQELTPNKFELLQTVNTAPKGRTLALDSTNGDIYIVAPDPNTPGTSPKPLILIKVSK